jgi:hypothetical protein
MKRKNGHLVFERSDKIEPFRQVLRPVEFAWGNDALFFNANCIAGNLFTNLGSPVSAWLLIKDSVDICAVDAGRFHQWMTEHRCDNPQNLTAVDVARVLKIARVNNRPDILEKVKPDLNCNCFGYCFGDGKYFVNDPATIIRDDYVPVNTPAKAEKMMLIANGHNPDSMGQYPWGYIHALNINIDGTISFKPGVTDVIENLHFNNFAYTYNYNRVEFFRARSGGEE